MAKYLRQAAVHNPTKKELSCIGLLEKTTSKQQHPLIFETKNSCCHIKTNHFKTNNTHSHLNTDPSNNRLFS